MNTDTNSAPDPDLDQQALDADPNPDSDPAKWFESTRIQIHNTGEYCNSWIRKQTYYL
jgi:hypothetical protein